MPLEKVVNQKKEAITKASHDIGFLLDDLQEAMSYANQIESIIILQLIEEAASLSFKINQFKSVI